MNATHPRENLLRAFAAQEALERGKLKLSEELEYLGPGFVRVPLPPGMKVPPHSCSECEPARQWSPMVPDVDEGPDLGVGTLLLGVAILGLGLLFYGLAVYGLVRMVQ